LKIGEICYNINNKKYYYIENVLGCVELLAGKNLLNGLYYDKPKCGE
jgi:hypothetical protein